MKNRREVRKNLIRGKKYIHTLEKEQEKLRRDCMANTGVEERWLRRPVNFHRPANVVMWNMSKRAFEHAMRAPSKSRIECRDIANARDQLNELSFEEDEEMQVISTSDVRVASPKYEVPNEKKYIRPGGRVERRMKQLEHERMIEDIQNANEFAKAVCNMQISSSIIDHKGDTLWLKKPWLLNSSQGFCCFFRFFLPIFICCGKIFCVIFWNGGAIWV